MAREENQKVAGSILITGECISSSIDILPSCFEDRIKPPAPDVAIALVTRILSGPRPAPAQAQSEVLRLNLTEHITVLKEYIECHIFG
ncbi:hypothetical protein EVAR_86088_1 [Eumeta japonica]|uniref:Uncharacterized protein n=1 Tax=Eumeta variegata TaxID=151549 RepID=A0A4C1V1Q7_EUMVA|nr:hypothetical protein EVAR_86088_1 [Eumeta japonica]